MHEAIDMALEEAKDQMEKALERLSGELRKVRAGKAHPSMLEGVKLDYYGTLTPISQVANVNTTDARTIIVQPWEKTMLDDIAAGIINANLGLNPMNNGEVLIINVPPLTEERRRELVKLSKAEAENAKVGVRNARKDANNELKKTELSVDQLGNAEVDVQALTDDYIKKIDDKYASKEDEIMKV